MANQLPTKDQQMTPVYPLSILIYGGKMIFLLSTGILSASI